MAEGRLSRLLGAIYAIVLVSQAPLVSYAAWDVEQSFRAAIEAVSKRDFHRAFEMFDAIEDGIGTPNVDLVMFGIDWLVAKGLAGATGQPVSTKTTPIQSAEFLSAISSMELAAQRNPTDDQLHYYLGRLYRFQGVFTPLGNDDEDPNHDSLNISEPRPFEKAALELRRAIELNPRAAEPHYYLGTIYSRQQRYDEAVVELEQAVTLDAGQFAYWTYLAGLYGAVGRLEQAETAYGTVLKMVPGHRDLATGQKLTFASTEIRHLKALVDRAKVPASVELASFEGRWEQKMLGKPRLVYPYLKAQELKELTEMLERQVADLGHREHASLMFIGQQNHLLRGSTPGGDATGFCYGRWFVFGDTSSHRVDDCTINEVSIFRGEVQGDAMTGTYSLQRSADDLQRCAASVGTFEYGFTAQRN